MRNNPISVSVIIPIYKVESFIVRCVESLFNQSLSEGVEFIFVNDATPDRSVELLQEQLGFFPSRKEQVILLEHAENKGLPAARNTGLSVAKGEYVFHCDSDDFLEADGLEKMYKAAKEQEADIVWCDWYLSFEKNERYMKQPTYETAMDALKGMLSGAMKYNVWNKLVKRQLYVGNHIKFPEGHGMGEDMTMIQLFACADKVCYLPQAYYHYVRLNAQAFTQMGGSPHKRQHLDDLRYNVSRILQFIKQRFGNQLDRELAFFMLDAKFPFLITDQKTSYQRWKEWFPEANRYIWQNKQISYRSRLLQLMAAKGQFWYVWLYYKLVIRLVYGVLYK